MDNPHEYPSQGGPPPRKELQGPRPTPLKVRKESHKIKKPPLAPPPPVVQHQQQPQQPPRQPVIIYTVSPKVIHTNPSEFMALVQRLTGPDTMSSSSTSSSSQYPSYSFTSSGAISPAARLASIERTKMPSEDKKLTGSSRTIQDGSGIIGGGCGEEEGVERAVLFPGILSPGPGSLPPISPNLFSPFFHDPISSSINLHHDLSVVQYGSKNYIEGSHMPSPFATYNFMVSPNTMFSPSSLDILHHILNN